MRNRYVELTNITLKSQQFLATLEDKDKKSWIGFVLLVKFMRWLTNVEDSYYHFHQERYQGRNRYRLVVDNGVGFSDSGVVFFLDVDDKTAVVEKIVVKSQNREITTLPDILDFIMTVSTKKAQYFQDKADKFKALLDKNSISYKDFCELYDAHMAVPPKSRDILLKQEEDL